MSNLPALGPYQLLQELGRGSRTVVYKAWQSSLGRPVALKVLHRYDAEALRKFQAEARLSARLNSPGVRRIHEAGQTPEGYIYVAMEYVEQSLQALLRQRQAQGQPFSRQEVSRLLTPVAQALDDMHRQGLVHLDIKPDNILVSQAGQAVLADFGISRRQGERTQEGTPLYLSPEQAAGDRPVGPWSDVYSLGALLYEMLTGRPPFMGEMDIVLIRQHLQDAPPAPRRLNPRLERDVERTLLAALSKDPRQRPPTAGALLQALAHPRRITPVSVAAETLRRQPLLALILLAPLVLALGLALILGDGDKPAATLTPLPPTPARPAPPVSATATLAPPPSPLPPAPPVEPDATATSTLAPPPTTVTAPTTPTTGAPPTSTARPTATPAPTAATRAAPPTPAPAATPVLREPLAGATQLGIAPINFRWDGRLGVGQSFVVYLRHVSSGSIQSPKLTGAAWTTKLPETQSGEWRWCVYVTPGPVCTPKQHFFYQPYP